MALATVPEIGERFASLRARLDERGHRGVTVVAVTKAHPPELIERAAAAGCRAIGENYAQELRDKAATLDGLAHRPEVHFIGRLQSNKIRQLVGLVDVWSSIDRVSLIDELARRSPDARVLLQVNATGESDKGGCAPGDAAALLERARGCRLDVAGLMTVGPTEGGPEAARPAFRTVNRLADELGLAVRSMGMTADHEVALDEGATEIRVGSLLFGPRPPA